MLSSLTIQNFAIIHRQEITFEPGLNVVTGESGAGKSVLLDALHLALGRRADTSVILDKSRKAAVEAIFTSVKKPVLDILEKNDLDTDGDLILRREVLPQGKSRAFVNDSPVKLSVMQQISALLIDLHEQFESLEVQTTNTQFDILDGYAGSNEERLAYSEQYNRSRHIAKQLDECRSKYARISREKDFLEFQLDEIDAALGFAGSLKEIEAEYGLLNKASVIQKYLVNAQHILVEDQNAVVERMRDLERNFAEVASDHADLEQVRARIESVAIELEDLHAYLNSLTGSIEPNEERKAFLEERIDTVRRQLLKHHKHDDQELAAYASSLRSQVLGIDDVAKQLADLENEQQVVGKQMAAAAKSLSEKRRGKLEAFGQIISKLLRDLEMKHAQFACALTALEGFGPRGIDEIDFLFSANKGGSMLPVSKIASGGEISRLSLCIKSVVAQKIDLPTMVFDEIDTGVSGQVAVKMGRLLADLGKSQQVIMITHSPQIAAYGVHHLQVSKNDATEKTLAEVKLLNEKERITEIAKMLSGDPPSEAALNNAKELIKQ